LLLLLLLLLLCCCCDGELPLENKFAIENIQIVVLTAVVLCRRAKFFYYNIKTLKHS
jgi:hypothetical protein